MPVRSFAEESGVAQLLTIATSSLREATNGADAIARVEEATGVPLQVLDGPGEARYTFLAIRRWFGWSAGRLLMLDIGGGSLEVASGADELPDADEIGAAAEAFLAQRSETDDL